MKDKRTEANNKGKKDCQKKETNKERKKET